MTRGVCLLLIVICACLPAFAQEKKPEKQETPHVFNHPDWTYPNKTEDRLVQVVEDMEKCVEGHLRRALIYNAGEIAKNGRAVIRQSIIDWTLDKVIFRLEGDFDFSVREVCPEALAKICDKEKIAGLMAHLTSERKKNIAEELEKLPWLEDPEKVKKDVEGQIGKAKKALLKALSEDKKNSVREKCAGYLPDISVDAETIKALIDALLKDGWSIVRIQAVDSLKRIKDPSCIPALRKALEKDSYSAVRSDAAAALGAHLSGGRLRGWLVERQARLHARPRRIRRQGGSKPHSGAPFRQEGCYPGRGRDCAHQDRRRNRARQACQGVR